MYNIDKISLNNINLIFSYEFIFNNFKLININIETGEISELGIANNLRLFYSECLLVNNNIIWKLGNEIILYEYLGENNYQQIKEIEFPHI